jgi:hypothetical protein
MLYLVRQDNPLSSVNSMYHKLPRLLKIASVGEHVSHCDRLGLHVFLVIVYVNWIDIDMFKQNYNFSVLVGETTNLVANIFAPAVR